MSNSNKHSPEQYTNLFKGWTFIKMCSCISVMSSWALSDVLIVVISHLWVNSSKPQSDSSVKLEMTCVCCDNWHFLHHILRCTGAMMTLSSSEACWRTLASALRALLHDSFNPHSALCTQKGILLRIAVTYFVSVLLTPDALRFLN